MATHAEYQVCLKERFEPLICDVGPVEAAHNVACFLANSGKIDLVVSLGSAGSAVLEQTQVYQASAVSYRDMDASPLGFERGVTPFLDVPAMVPLTMTIPDLPLATLSTGANIVSGNAYKQIAADMVDMETWAIMRACHRTGVPMIGLRGISDGAKPLQEYADWTHFLEVIDQQLASAVDQLEQALVAGTLVPGL